VLLKLRGCLPEAEARLVLRQVVRGMADIASASIIHRDLKLANILLHFPTKDLLSISKHKRLDIIKKINLGNVKFEVKISDFGFAKLQKKSRRKRENSICGTPAYMAPDQILDGNEFYTEKFDVWSLGAIYYELLVGQPPFIDKTKILFEKRLKDGNYDFPENLAISPEGMLFISKCLQYRENDRASIFELANDSYLVGEKSIGPVFEKRLPSPVAIDKSQMFNSTTSTTHTSTSIIKGFSGKKGATNTLL
jgi:serine/threonine protein kinase